MEQVELDSMAKDRAELALAGLTRPEVEAFMVTNCGPGELAAITDIINRLARATGRD